MSSEERMLVMNFITLDLCCFYCDQAVFVGHNHGLDWCCPYKKLWLCFARHTGYGGYGNWPRGARVLEINQQPFSLKSWIRMEDGSTHSEVILSSWSFTPLIEKLHCDRRDCLVTERSWVRVPPLPSLVGLPREHPSLKMCIVNESCGNLISNRLIWPRWA